MIFEISNCSDGDINVTLEPVGDNIVIPVKTISSISLDNEASVRIDVYDMAQMNIWTEGHVTVKIGNSTMEFPPMT